MSLNNPNKLVEEFKKSGEFERIRRELLTQFQGSEGLAAFKARIEDVARRRLTNDHNLLYMPQEFIHRELMQELDRLPIVEQSASELPMLNDSTFSARINDSLEKLLQDHGITVNTPQEKPRATQRPDTLTGDKEGDKDAQPSSTDATTRERPSKSPQDASGIKEHEDKTKPKDTDSMDVDGQ